MRIKLKIHKICFLLAFLILCSAIAQDKPSSPEGYLARAAGAYLGAHEYIFRLRESECGFAVVKVPKSYEQTINDEIVPAFQPEFRVDLKNILLNQKGIIKKSSDDYVKSLVASALRESRQEQKVVCGILFGTLAGTAGQSHQNWLDTVNKYGVKRN